MYVCMLIEYCNFRYNKQERKLVLNYYYYSC